ncbi:hypothetical protein F5X98DRAFT_367904 [Xylaria grammica]|nr:hypothetical protein F5X98DRAFT_367904 [Xylaria grammica]
MSSSSAGFQHLSETRQPDLYASSTVPIFFSVVCVALRFWCRWKTKAGLWLDDWLILAALLSGIGLTVDTLWWIPRGLGKHVEAFGPDVLWYWAIGVFITELTYTGSIVFVKLSVVSLYWRIFGRRTSIGLHITILTASILAWGISVFLLILLQCIPTRGIWDDSIEASCHVNRGVAILVTCIPNVILDLLLLALPIRYVASLNLYRQQRREIISIFLLGGFVCIASIVRLVSTIPQPIHPDVTWNTISQIIWSDVEVDFAIISACLPTMRPVWLAIRPKIFTSRTSESSNQTPTPKRKVFPWSMSILTSKVGTKGDSEPFSRSGQAAEIDLGDNPGHTMYIGTAT